jgi:hypothetical protein
VEIRPELKLRSNRWRRLSKVIGVADLRLRALAADSARAFWVLFARYQKEKKKKKTVLDNESEVKTDDFGQFLALTICKFMQVLVRQHNSDSPLKAILRCNNL